MQTRNRIIGAAILARSVGANADEITSSPVRSILERHDQSNVAGKEIVLGTAALPAGSVNPRGSVHSLLAAPGTDGGIAVSTWIVDMDKPLATTVDH
jgi:hypothetical protein